MPKFLIVGAGQSGLHLALGLQEAGHQVTVVSNRTADEVRTGPVTSSQCMFDEALQLERDLGIHFWDGQAPLIQGIGISIAASDGSRPIDWLGQLDSYAQSIDQRIKIARWIETFSARGGELIVENLTVSALDAKAAAYDLVIVATGRGEIGSLFTRNDRRSTYSTPQRTLALAYVHGVEVRPEHPTFDAVRFNVVPGAGELFVIPTLTTSGRADILFWEIIPDGPLDIFGSVKRPIDHLNVTLDLMKRYVPWEYQRARKSELCDAAATLTGQIIPTVRNPVAVLPSGQSVLGLGDSIVLNDPITGQGSNSASKAATSYLKAIKRHSNGPFDHAWMQATFENYWKSAEAITKWTNSLLRPPSAHMLELISSAAEMPIVAHRFVNGFNNPADFEEYFFDPVYTHDWLKEAHTITQNARKT